jgi:succinyl-diaminopimelate desuccinylase
VADHATARALAEVYRRWRHDLGRLERWLAIPSVSVDRAHRNDVVKAAAWWRTALLDLGADVQALPAAPGPVVVADLAGPRGSPTLLVYGHYDVQPAGSAWTTPPFVPTRRGSRLIARGAADDKGQLMAVLAALQAWVRAGGPPCRVVVVAEGAEEVGSGGLRPALARVAARVAPDAILVCDTERAPDGVPSLTVSQRGALHVTLTVGTGGAPVHPGRLGGAVVDPSRLLLALLGRIEAAVRRVAQPADAPPPAVVVRSDADIRRLAAGRAVTGSGLDDRVSAWPAFSITRLAAGSAAGAIPTTAAATVDVRLPPGADPRRAARALTTVARDAGRAGVAVRWRITGHRRGGWLVPEPGQRAAVDRAALSVFGAPARLVRSGGSLPAADLLGDVFGVVPLLLGLAPAGSRAHGPDEYLDIPGWVCGVRLLVHTISDLASSSVPGVPRSGAWPGTHKTRSSIVPTRGVGC